jgi:hypothetical protein
VKTSAPTPVGPRARRIADIHRQLGELYLALAAELSGDDVAPPEPKSPEPERRRRARAPYVPAAAVDEQAAVRARAELKQRGFMDLSRGGKR